MGSVYVIEADNGEVKVGIASAPLSRLTTIVREYGPRRGFRTARVAAYFDCDDPPVIEVWAHRLLRDRWVDGEWFRAPVMESVHAVISAGMFNGESLSARWPAHEAWLRRRK